MNYAAIFTKRYVYNNKDKRWLKKYIIVICDYVSRLNLRGGYIKCLDNM